MKRLRAKSFCVVGCASILLACTVARLQAQNAAQSPAASNEPAKTTAPEAEEDPFVPEPASPLPPGMTGPDVNDPRYTLKPGLYDAGEASVGLKHLLLIRKPDAFQLGSNDPDDPTVPAGADMMHSGG